MNRHEDIRGRRFGRLTAMEFEGTNQNGNAIWKVRCDCGTEFSTLAVFMKNGNTKSCGCLKAEMARMAKLRRHEKENTNKYDQ